MPHVPTANVAAALLAVLQGAHNHPVEVRAAHSPLRAPPAGDGWVPLAYITDALRRTIGQRYRTAAAFYCGIRTAITSLATEGAVEVIPCRTRTGSTTRPDWLRLTPKKDSQP